MGWVPSLVGELRFHMPQRLGKKKKKKVDKTAENIKKAENGKLGTIKGRGWRK